MPIRESPFLELRPIQRPVGLLLMDIDGPMVFRDKADPKVLELLVQLALRGIFVHCITGRSAQEIKDRVFPVLEKITSELNPRKLEALSRRLTFAGEIGAVEVRLNGSFTINLSLKDYPLFDRQVREALSVLMWQPEKLKRWMGSKEEAPSNFEVIWDANNNAYLVPRDPLERPLLPEFIASEVKIINFTAELVRDEKGNVPRINMTEADGPVDIIRAKLKELGVDSQIDILPTRTAIDLVPKGINKGMAAGWVIKKIWEGLNRLGVRISLKEVAKRSLAFGDGYQDFEMARPRIEEGRRIIGKVPFAFVGSKSQFREDRTTDTFFVPVSDEHIATEATLAILEHLQRAKVFKPFLEW